MLQVQCNPITLKADIGPTVLLNLKKVKIGYTYNIIGRTHQALVVVPIIGSPPIPIQVV